MVPGDLSERSRTFGTFQQLLDPLSNRNLIQLTGGPLEEMLDRGAEALAQKAEQHDGIFEIALHSDRIAIFARSRSGLVVCFMIFSGRPILKAGQPNRRGIS
jgi:hypothetical protein